MRRTIVSLAAVLGLLVAGCASSPEDIEAAYVSPLEYRSYDCDQLEQEMLRVSRKVQEITRHQGDEAEGDSVAVGLGLFFWPALFFLAGEDKEEELAQLKGEMEAVEQAAIDKKCHA